MQKKEKFAIIYHVRDILDTNIVGKEVITIDRFEDADSGHGQILFQRYQIDTLIGTGGFARVYRCRDLITNRMVAVKQARKSAASYASILNESEILKILKHPSIPTLYDIQQDEKYYYLAEEFLEGQLLSKYQKTKKLDMEEIINMISAICEVIGYLHKCSPPVFYLDLQPENIIVAKECVYLPDFGNAARAGEQHRRKQFAGTPGYAPPEQYYGEVDERSDIYGIGAILYYLIFMKSPEHQDTASMDKLPEILQRMLKTSMKHRKEERYASVREMQEQLDILTEITGKKNRDTSLIFSFAGSLSRIGTTHISLAFSEYLGQQGYRVLYEEHNSSGAAQNAADVYQLKNFMGTYRLRHFTIFPYYSNMIQRPEEPYDIIIRDFGLLTEENEEDYRDSDGMVLLCGSKPWEISRMGRMDWEKKPFYLVNFAGVEDFRNFEKARPKELLLRIPVILNFLEPEEYGKRFLAQLQEYFFGETPDKKGRWRRYFSIFGRKQPEREPGMGRRPERR